MIGNKWQDTLKIIVEISFPSILTKDKKQSKLEAQKYLSSYNSFTYEHVLIERGKIM